MNVKLDVLRALENTGSGSSRMQCLRCNK